MTDKTPDPLSEGVPPVPEQAPTEASTLTGLAQLAGALSQQSMNAEQREVLVNDILGRINAAPDDVKAALAKNASVKELVRTVLETEPVAPKGAQPGSYTYRMINGEKSISGVIDWSWADLDGMARKTFTPNETKLIGWNGLFITLIAEQETTLPEVFYGIWMDYKRNTMLAHEHAAFLMKKGPMPRDPTILTPNGMRSRAIANHDGRINLYAPGAGNIPEWTPAVDEAMGEATPVGSAT